MKKGRLVINILIFILIFIITFLFFFYLMFNENKIRNIVIHAPLLSYNKDIKSSFLNEIGVPEKSHENVTLSNIFDEYIISLSISDIETFMSREALKNEFNKKKINVKIPSKTDIEININKVFSRLFRNDMYLFLKYISLNKLVYLFLIFLVLILFFVLFGISETISKTFLDMGLISICLNILLTIIVIVLQNIIFSGDILAKLINLILKDGLSSFTFVLMIYYLGTALFFGLYYLFNSYEMRKRYNQFEELSHNQNIDIFNDDEVISRRLDNIIMNSSFHLKGDHEGYIVDNNYALYKYEIVYIKEKDTLNDKVYIFKYSDKIDMNVLYDKISGLDYNNRHDKYHIDIHMKKLNVCTENKETYDEISQILENIGIVNRKEI